MFGLSGREGKLGSLDTGMSGKGGWLVWITQAKGPEPQRQLPNEFALFVLS